MKIELADVWRTMQFMTRAMILSSSLFLWLLPASAVKVHGNGASGIMKYFPISSFINSASEGDVVSVSRMLNRTNIDVNQMNAKGIASKTQNVFFMKL